MFDTAFAFLKVVGSALLGEAKALVYSTQAFGDDVHDDEAEVSGEDPVYGALGVYGVPLPPDAAGYAEAIGARRADGFAVFAQRDLRIMKARGNRNPGAQGIAGYNGAFVNIEPADGGTGDMVQIYVPYEHDGDGVPAKAHGILVDTKPGNESIVIAHGDGFSITLTQEGKINICSKNGENMLTVEDDGVSISGDFKVVTGMLAGDVVSAQPVMLATTLLAWIAEVNVALGVIAAAAGNNPNPTIAVPTSVPVPSTKLSASP